MAPEMMSALRYRNVLRAEGRFIAELPAGARLCYRGRLVWRAARLLPRAPALSWLSLRWACAWRAESASRGS
jgi:hypothetical protein